MFNIVQFGSSLSLGSYSYSFDLVTDDDLENSIEPVGDARLVLKSSDS